MEGSLQEKKQDQIVQEKQQWFPILGQKSMTPMTKCIEMNQNTSKCTI